MTFLLMLLLIFFYIFVVTGVYFLDYTPSPRQDLEYRDLPNSLVTVFILFTLDHWYALLQDVWKVREVSRIFSSIYFILWLLLGSIIFRSIIVAVMVTNFQNIRKEMNEEMARQEVQLKADMFKRQIIQRSEALRSSHSKIDDSSRVGGQRRESLDLSEVSEVESIYGATEEDLVTSASKTEETLSKKREYQSSSSVSSTSSSYSSSSESRFSESIGHLDWETLVHENLPGLMEMDQDDRVWPRDSLFRYFELLEKLQYNLEERKKLQEFAGMELGHVYSCGGGGGCPLFWHLSFSISAYT
uniref:Cation channel sperm associated 2 n=1 Tax=Piliocolobus tephrosceles TaxID=591936 RepID=A0A8C9GTI6_9PRIM